MRTKELTTCAALVAIYVVLKYVSFDVGPVKFTFAPFPILVGAMLFGPFCGFVIGMLAEGIVQMITYGIGVTTLLWMLPVGLRGLMSGAYAKKHHFELNTVQIILNVLITGLVVTLLNTALLYLDGMIFRYPVQYTAIAIIMRFVSSVVMTAMYCLVLPKTLQLIRRAVPLTARQSH